MLSVFIGILTVVMVIVSVLLVLIVLMQRPKQEGLGAAFGGGMMDSVAGAHTTDVLQKGTTWLAGIFLGAAILLAILNAQKLKAIDPGEVLPAVQAEPAAPSLPPSIGDMPEPSTEPAIPSPAPAESTPEAPDSTTTQSTAPETSAPAEEAKETTTPAAADDSAPSGAKTDSSEGVPSGEDKAGQ